MSAFSTSSAWYGHKATDVRSIDLPSHDVFLLTMIDAKFKGVEEAMFSDLYNTYVTARFFFFVFWLTLEDNWLGCSVLQYMLS